MRVIDLTGKRFGSWTVRAIHKRIQYDRCSVIYWLCRCDCGTERPVCGGSLRRGISTNCGCLRRGRLTHGMANTPFYYVWVAMKQRCLNANSTGYRDYGARGITVCERWLKFVNFYTDMWATYRPGLMLDRIDNDGNYEPGNCRWTTRLEQNRNQRRHKRKARRAKLAEIQAFAASLARVASASTQGE